MSDLVRKLVVALEELLHECEQGIATSPHARIEALAALSAARRVEFGDDMTTTPAMPEPELGYIKTDKSRQPAFSARQMREAMQSAQPAAAVSDELNPADIHVEVLLQNMGGFAPVQTHGVRVTHTPSGISVSVASERSQHKNKHLAWEKLRAILALRPQAVPMTDEQVDRIWNALPMGNGFWLSFARAVEAHNGTTQRADGGEQQA